MTVVFLDVPEECWDAPIWSDAVWREPEGGMMLRRYRSTTISELLERGRDADALVTCTFPLRREVLDYLTRVKHIVVPRDQADRLVERAIAAQLGISVHVLDTDVGAADAATGSAAACRFFDAVPHVLKRLC